MKFATFNDSRIGIVIDSAIVDVTEANLGINAVTAQGLLNGIMENFDSLRTKLDEIALSGSRVPVSSVKLGPPVPRPGKIVAMAVNYMENGALKEKPPIHAFLKSRNAIIGPGDTIILPKSEANVFHHEAELGVVIGKEGTNIAVESAFDHVFGYMNFIDVSARGLSGGNFFWNKSWDTFAPIGPYIVTKNEIADPQALPIKLTVNGVLRQELSTSDMAHNVAACIAWISSITTLDPGDIIATGTNHQGLGAIQDDDVIEMEISGLGSLKVNVRDDLKRQWPTEIDSTFADRMAGRA
ncbi:MAG: 2-keto-4-pentenoate hydratase/2-oxohepta-3-ene-1,7-dioic acid hydratase (catechol pathway) [Chloroflexi bacterium]|nr:MAG: 2-keto-4-pentenoate hydratase/2-oxohepta-3-ene-1,7-dioic acid hydratase (catechol pathway) [Chloroflexota bacterium]